MSEFQPFMTNATNNLQDPSPKVKTDAQKEALKAMRQKFRYPRQDPAPNEIIDTRSDLEEKNRINPEGNCPK